jgi:hypothetical protein
VAKSIITDIDSDYAMKPGKWRIDRIIDIPSEAISGVYSIEIEFSNSQLKFKESENFVVKQ